MAGYTANYGLHQWEPGDDFLRTDFNEDFQKIDELIPRMIFGSYVGSGTCSTVETELDLGFAPKFIMIRSTVNNRFITAFYGGTTATVAISTSGYYIASLSWTGTGLKWINQNSTDSEDQLNKLGEVYHYLAIA